MTRAELKAQAEAQTAAFLSKGGKVEVGPDVVPTRFTCGSCGHVQIVGRAAGKQVRCSRCGIVSDGV